VTLLNIYIIVICIDARYEPISISAVSFIKRLGDLAIASR
jgi:hypothetical protein